jgi:hypothetical protein
MRVLVERKMAVSGWVKDLASFAVLVLVASWQGWEAKELIWGLWISSLVVGYTFILISAVSIYFTGNIPGEPKNMKNLKIKGLKEVRILGMNVFVTIAAFFVFGPLRAIPWIVLLVNALFAGATLYLTYGPGREDASVIRGVARRFFAYTPAVVFTLGFFTLHFGGFHFVHGMFLNTFFPIVEGTPFGESIGGTFAFVFGIVNAAARSYWPFVLISAWSRLGDMKKSLEPGREPNMFLPYISVVKMHILIFVFAGLSAAGLQAWALYPVLFFYFFPAGTMFRAFFGKVTGGRKELTVK